MNTRFAPALANLDDLVVDAACYLDVSGPTWNGFAVPYMTREQVDILRASLDAYRAAEPEAQMSLLTWEGDTLVETDTEHGEMDRDHGRIIVVDGAHVRVWCPGGFSWTWSARLVDAQP